MDRLVRVNALLACLLFSACGTTETPSSKPEVVVTSGESPSSAAPSSRAKPPAPRNPPAPPAGTADAAAPAITREQPPLSKEQPPAPEKKAAAPPSTAVAAAKPLTDGKITASTPFVLKFESARGGKAAEVGLNLAKTDQPAELNLEASGEGVSFSILRYVPAIALQELIAPAPAAAPGPPALHLSIKTPQRKWDTWLVPGSRVLGRTSLRPAWIELLPAVEPGERPGIEEFLQRLHDAKPKILFERKRDGRRFLLPATQGSVGRVKDSDYRIQVLHAFTCFSLDSSTGKAANVDPRPLNPAIQIEITHAGQTRTAWLFSHLPEFSRGSEDENMILRYVWNVEDHPHARAEITIVDSAAWPLRAYAGYQGETSVRDLSPNTPLTVGATVISVLERIPSSAIQQETVTGLGPGGPAALVSWKQGAVRAKRWIPLGATEEIRAGGSITWVRLEKRGSGQPGKMQGHGASAPSLGLPLGHPPLPGDDASRPSSEGSPSKPPAEVPPAKR